MVKRQQTIDKQFNTAITYTHQVKNLGFIINSKIDCVSHINATLQKIYLVLRKLWYIASYLHDDLKWRLVKTNIIPFKVYGANVYENFDSCSMRKLQLVINNFARIVYNKRKYDHISQYSSNILGTSLEAFLNARNLLLLHKITLTTTPLYLHECLTFSSSRRSHNILVPVHKYQKTSRMVFLNAAKL